MNLSEWARPAALTELAVALGATTPVDREAWSDLVSRATAAGTLVRVQQDMVDGEDAGGEPEAGDTQWLTDFVGAWLNLGKEHPDATEVAAGLAAQLGVLDEDQLQALTESVETTADELRSRDLVEAGEHPDPTDAAESEQGDEGGSAEQEFMRSVGSELTRRTGVVGVPSELSGMGLDLGVTQQARSIAGSLVPDGLGQFLPEAAVVSLAASAGMRIRNGESVPEVKQWLVGELSTIGVANAASVAVQLLSGLVVLRPLAVLGAKWERARAESSAQATVAIRASRERLAPLLGD